MKAFSYPDEKLKRLIAETSQSFLELNFPPRPAIEGQEILHFSGNPQVNRFLLFQIYQEWNLYISKIKHPFFDFHHTEVREALQAFQNILSQHIRVERSDFKPLLDKAIYNTFRLILQPMELLSGFFFLNKSSVPLAQFERYAPYFIDFDFIVGSLSAYYQKNQVHEIDRSDFIDKAERLALLYEKRTEQTLDEYRGILFHKLTGQELKEFLNATPHPSKASGSPAFSTDELNDYLGPALRKPASVEPASSLKDVNNTNDIQPLNEVETLANKLYSQEPAISQQKTSLPPTDFPTFPSKTNSAKISNSIPSSNPPTIPARLADQFQGQGNTLNNRFNNQGIMSTLSVESIPMHKQFQYVQKVFAGNRKLFKDTIDALNNLSKEEEAMNYLQTRILNMPEVNQDEPVVLEFVELVRSRY
jgi:hypothetical protein